MAHLTTGFPLVHPLSESAMEIMFGTQPDAATRQALTLAMKKLRTAPFLSITDLTPAYTSITVHFHPASVKAAFPENAALKTVFQLLEEVLVGTGSPADEQVESPLVEIPVRYGGQWGIDLPKVAERLGMTERAVIEQHCEVIYTVFMVGFLPGFPYLGVLPEALQLPRRSTPRSLVQAGSVAIAGQQTGIYPQASPGGWHIIGHTELRLFEPQKKPPSLLQPGFRVRFIPI